MDTPIAFLEDDMLLLLNDNLTVDNDSSLFDKFRC